MKDLVLYNRMISAISHCSKVDEVKDIRDKALALEHYARQATNVDAERQAINVRVRAERRAGEILRSYKKVKEEEIINQSTLLTLNRVLLLNKNNRLG